MEFFIEEMSNSWTHCKELIKSSAKKEVVLAFLEDFKVQFTRFYNHIKRTSTQSYHQHAFALVDKAYLFWGKKGELSYLIDYVNKNWDMKSKLLKRIEFVDEIITKLLSQYQQSLKHF